MAKPTSAQVDTHRLKANYENEHKPALKESLGLENLNQVPKLQKIVVSVGLGRAKEDKRIMEAAANTLRKITGQQPVPTIAKKSIASFKLREGQVIGMKVTLRQEKMYEFADKLINVVLPRLRDFHGVSPKAFDGQGNFNLGFEDQSVWPELSFDDTAAAHGIEVTFVTTADSNEHGKALLESLGMPFMKEGSK